MSNGRDVKAGPLYEHNQADIGQALRRCMPVTKDGTFYSMLTILEKLDQAQRNDRLAPPVRL